MPSNDTQTKSNERRVRVLEGTAPRKASPKPEAWNSGKPPGGNLPPKEK